MARRKLTWVRYTNLSQALVAAPAGAAFDILDGWRQDMGILRNLPGMTVARIRLNFFVGGMTSPGAPPTVAIRVANIKEVQEAQADSSYALNNGPINDETADWMFYNTLYPNHGSDPTTGLPNAATYEFDVKAMRKLDEPDQTLGLFTSKLTTTAGLTVNSAISALLMLP